MGRGGDEEAPVAESTAWEVLRNSDELVTKALENELAVRALRQEAPVGKAALQAALTLHRCSCCGSFSIQQRPGTDSTRTVYWVGTSGATMLKVPMYDCLRCSNVFHAHPAAIGGFPSTPVNALKLHRSHSDNEAAPIWLDTLLLSSIVSLQFESAATSEGAFCSAVCAVVDKASSGELHLDKKRLQCLLGSALEEYLVVALRLLDVVDLGVANYPVNKERLLSCCGACWQAGQLDAATGSRRTLHSVYMDACMKFRHLVFSPIGSQPALQQRIATIYDRPADLPALFSNARSVRGSNSWCCSVAGDMNGILALLESEAKLCGGEFVSARATSGRSAKVNISGIFGAFCRHGFFLAGASMACGERYAFGCLVLYLITAQNGTKIDFCWYDIGPCKFKVSHMFDLNVMRFKF